MQVFYSKQGVKYDCCFLQVNEISWNNTNDLFFLTNGHGCINILR